jgi:hypothetical protein
MYTVRGVFGNKCAADGVVLLRIETLLWTALKMVRDGQLGEEMKGRQSKNEKTKLSLFTHADVVAV